MSRVPARVSETFHPFFFFKLSLSLIFAEKDDCSSLMYSQEQTVFFSRWVFIKLRATILFPILSSYVEKTDFICLNKRCASPSCKIIIPF